MRIGLIVMVLFLILSADRSAADSITARNSMGIYVTPSTHRYKEQNRYDLAQSSTSLEFSLFYNKFLSPRISLQVEAKNNARFLDITFGSAPARLSESFLELPIICRIRNEWHVGDSIIRIYAGGGLYYSILTSQKLTTQGDVSLLNNPIHTSDAGDYHKFGGLLDAGGVLHLTKRLGVLAGFRYYEDLDVFSISDDVVVAPLYFAYGVYMGLEHRF